MRADSGRDNSRSENENGACVESCNVRLEVFEGPLDLLLYLIRKEEIDIYDIPIARVTEQYLRYLEMMRMLNLNFAGEFLAMAATLMYIKSRMLLPPQERSEEEEEEVVEDPRAELVRQLVEYKEFKEVADRLQEMEAEQQFTFHRRDTTVPSLEEVEHPLSEVTIFDLLSAFSDALERAAAKEQLHEVEEEQVTVEEQMEVILGRLSGQKGVLFHTLFPEKAGRITIVATFLALLELVRARKIVALQEQPFGEIVIRTR